jgi:hypothetical protein
MMAHKMKMAAAVLFAAVLFAVVMVDTHGRTAILIGFIVGGFISIVGYVSLRKKLLVKNFLNINSRYSAFRIIKYATGPVARFTLKFPYQRITHSGTSQTVEEESCDESWLISKISRSWLRDTSMEEAALKALQSAKDPESK